MDLYQKSKSGRQLESKTKQAQQRCHSIEIGIWWVKIAFIKETTLENDIGSRRGVS